MTDKHTVVLSDAARTLVSLMLAPTFMVEHERVTAPGEVWAEVRAAFPLGDVPEECEPELDPRDERERERYLTDLLADRLEAAGWPGVAGDVREGVPLEVIDSRLHRMDVEGEDVGEALEIIAQTM